ncbi:hypothetical protein BJF85_20125 [Saccharomonospora sp. CUA-673]|uniref:WXG100 family type VII secretion target n=1 Tax=Saccharomonospora sp. CUA-673 TaxID=1904969 RepID=UPI000958E858|nr:hypothetical protein [Saccharomonospora sp. CUA-673]OLT44191.1 hypothetical protein BJF85_20125 [Saccharomonospora sp. CUA-673]
MSGGYSVNIDELGTLITTLDEGAQEIRRANKQLADKGRGDFGSPLLVEAAGAFDEEWEWGLGKLDEAAENVIERLESAKRNYQELEDTVQESIAKVGEGVLGGAPPSIGGGIGSDGPAGGLPPGTGPGSPMGDGPVGGGIVSDPTPPGQSPGATGVAGSSISDILGGGS